MLQVLKPVLWPEERRDRYRKRAVVALFTITGGWMLMGAPIFLPESLRDSFFETIGIPIFLWLLITISTYGAILGVFVIFKMFVFGLHGDEKERRASLVSGALGIVALIALTFSLLEVNEWVSQI